MNTRFYETKHVAHVATRSGNVDIRWQPMCRRSVGIRSLNRLRMTGYDARRKPWCRHCVREVTALFADVVGAP